MFISMVIIKYDCSKASVSTNAIFRVISVIYEV